MFRTRTRLTRRGRSSRATTRSAPGVKAMRHVLRQFDYDDKDHELVGEPDPLIVGPAAELFCDATD